MDAHLLGRLLEAVQVGVAQAELIGLLVEFLEGGRRWLHGAFHAHDATLLAAALTEHFHDVVTVAGLGDGDGTHFLIEAGGGEFGHHLLLVEPVVHATLLLGVASGILAELHYEVLELAAVALHHGEQAIREFLLLVLTLAVLGAEEDVAHACLGHIGQFGHLHQLPLITFLVRTHHGSHRAVHDQRIVQLIGGAFGVRGLVERARIAVGHDEEAVVGAAHQSLTQLGEFLHGGGTVGIRGGHREECVLEFARGLLAVLAVVLVLVVVATQFLVLHHVQAVGFTVVTLGHEAEGSLGVLGQVIVLGLGAVHVDALLHQGGVLAVQAVLGDTALLDLVVHRCVDLHALEVLLQFLGARLAVLTLEVRLVLELGQDVLPETDVVVFGLGEGEPGFFHLAQHHAALHHLLPHAVAHLLLHLRVHLLAEVVAVALHLVVHAALELDQAHFFTAHRADALVFATRTTTTEQIGEDEGRHGPAHQHQQQAAALADLTNDCHCL